MSNKVWITLLSKDPEKANIINSHLSKYGLSFDGSLFLDDLEKMSWSYTLDQLKNKGTGLWIICGTSKELTKSSVLKGLSFAALGAKYTKGEKFPIIIVTDKGMDTKELPLPLKNSIILDFENPSIGVKATAKANSPVKREHNNFRLNILPMEGSGLWIEAGPLTNEWKGIFAGVLKPSSVDAMGVGKKEKIPDKSILEYPIRGIELEIGGKEFHAWAAKNIIKKDASFFFRISRDAGSVIIGDFEDDQPDVFVIDLC